MKTKKIKIGRYINGITLNPMEFVLDERGNIKTFESINSAKTFLMKVGINNFEGYYFEREEEKLTYP